MAGRKWSVEEDNTIKEFYSVEGARLCSEVLDRSISAVQIRAQKLGVKSRYFDLKSTDQYIDELEAKGISYRPVGEYKGCKTAITHRCPLGHEWNTSTPSNILTFNAGCTVCASTGFNPHNPAKLYYVKIYKEDKVYYKIGITGRDNWKRRFASDSSCIFKLLHLEEFLDGSEAKAKEDRIKEKYKLYKTKDKPLTSGNTEVFDTDILNLDLNSSGPHLAHRHLVVTASIKKPPQDTEYIKEWLERLVKALNMKIMLPPIAAYSNMIGNKGLTALVVIETSNIALHCWDEENPGVLQLDVYSCSEVDPKIIWKAMEEFDPIHKDYTFLDRADGFITVVEKSS